jgi:hypothetical protein
MTPLTVGQGLRFPSVVVGRRRSFPSAWLIFGAVAVVVEFALIALWQRNGYWEFSDGVYLLSGREFLHGLVPYRDFAAAQPPGVYLVGAGLLWVHDGLAAARAGLGIVGLITAVLVGVAVWRLTERPELTVIAVLAAPLLPITLHEHAQLIPETLAAPLILGAALACTRAERTVLCALLLVLACACKLAFVVPALAVIAASPYRRRLLVTFIVIGLVLAGVSLLVFGTAEWRETVLAQLRVGDNSLHAVRGLLLQGAWNELPLMALAAGALWAAWREPATVGDAELVRPLAAAAVAGLVLVLTVLKRGSYIDVLVVAEPPLLALAVCGAGWIWQRRLVGRPIVVVGVAWLAVQSVSILTTPSAPWAAKRPFAASGLEWTAGPSTVNQLVSAARACPVGRAYSGVPYIAFLADRRMPGDQPDTFIIENSSTDTAFARRAAADVPLCPGS